MDELFGPFAWPKDRPKPQPVYWPAILVIAAIPVFWIVVGALLWRAIT